MSFNLFWPGLGGFCNDGSPGRDAEGTDDGALVGIQALTVPASALVPSCVSNSTTVFAPTPAFFPAPALVAGPFLASNIVSAPSLVL